MFKLYFPSAMVRKTDGGSLAECHQDDSEKRWQWLEPG